ncbi:MAG: DNA/RNA non-specific endonuclease [Lachnospirales bacterium]
MRKSIGNIIKKASNSIGKVLKSGKQEIKKVNNGIKSKPKSIGSKAKSSVGNVVKGVKKLPKNIVNKAKSTIGKVVNAKKNIGNQTREKVKVKAIKGLEENILKKLKNQVKETKENGFFKSVVRGKVIRGAKNYYTKSKEEFIKTLNEKGKGKYGNTKFNDLLSRELDLGKKGGKLLKDTGDYLENSLNQIVKGSYAGDETNLLGTLGEIAVGCIPIVGQAADVREIVYDIQNWEWKWSNAGDLALDVIGFIPLVGDGVKAIKKVPFKEIGNSIKKGGKDAGKILNSAKKSINTYVEKITKKGLTKGIKEIETEGLENIKNFSKEVKEGLENLLDSFKPQENLAFAGGINSKNTDKFSGGVKIDKVESTNVDLHNKNKVKNIYERNKAELNSNNNNNNGVIIKDGTHLEEGKLKPNIKYKVGEYDYIYETDSKGRICKFETDNLQLTKREERLKHDPNTPGKIEGDHAGHLAGDRFGGSSEIDNLVSQTSKNNLSDYKKLENKWAKAIKENKKVEVNISIEYNKDDLRPSKFIIDYYIDGNKSKIILRN